MFSKTRLAVFGVLNLGILIYAMALIATYRWPLTLDFCTSTQTECTNTVELMDYWDDWDWSVSTLCTAYFSDRMSPLFWATVGINAAEILLLIVLWVRSSWLAGLNAVGGIVSVALCIVGYISCTNLMNNSDSVSSLDCIFNVDSQPSDFSKKYDAYGTFFLVALLMSSVAFVAKLWTLFFTWHVK